MTENIPNFTQSDRVCGKSILNLLIESWKTVAGGGVLGLVSAIFFISVTPNQYEVSAQIKIAQINSFNSKDFQLSPLEDPAILFARIKSPTFFSEKEVEACQLDKERDPKELLAKGFVRLIPVRGVVSLVELRVRSKSKKDALFCAQAIFGRLKDSQEDAMKSYLDNSRVLLFKYQERLKELSGIITKLNTPQNFSLATNYIDFSELKFLNQEVVRLSMIISGANIQNTTLFLPIYASDNAVFPKKKLSLILGLCSGLFLGLVCVLIRGGLRSCLKLRHERDMKVNKF